MGAPALIREHRVELPGGLGLSCRSVGSGVRQVMFLHGFPEAAFAWDEVLLALAPRVCGLAPNLPGFANPDPPGELAAYHPRALVATLVMLIEATGGPLDLLVAHDWGGALAWSLAARRPDLLKQLLIINAPHPAAFLRELQSNAAQQAASAYMNWLCRPDAEQLLRENDFARLFGLFGAAAWLTEARRERYREVWRQGLTGPLNYYRASALRPPSGPSDPLHTRVLRDEDVDVKIPTTVLWGERDAALLPSLLDGLPRWVPQLQVVREPDASHWIVHEAPQTVVTLIEGLLA